MAGNPAAGSEGRKYHTKHKAGWPALPAHWDMFPLPRLFGLWFDFFYRVFGRFVTRGVQKRD
jgi:hypothetical protein